MLEYSSRYVRNSTIPLHSLLCVFVCRCDYCLEWRHGGHEEEYARHLRMKHISREEKERDKENRGLVYISFDLQQIKQVPFLAAGTSFYKRKLVLFNLTFAIVKDNVVSGHCYTWTEVDGQRGGNEIASCLHNLLRTVLAEDNNIVFWSDGCVGQNKNRMVMAALLSAIHERPVGTEMSIKYFETGHSQMEADSIHATIDRAAKDLEFGTPEAWHTIFQAAKVRPPRYVVKVMANEDFLDFGDLSARAINPYALTGIKKWHMAKFGRVDGRGPSSITFEVSEEYSETLQRRTWTKSGAPANLSLVKAAYRKVRKVKQKKLKDCLELAPKLNNPRPSVAFFQNLLAEQQRLYPTRGDDSSDEEDE